MFRYFLLFLFFGFTISCANEKMSELTEISQDGKTKIHLVGTKDGVLEPFKVMIHVQVPDLPEQSLPFELQASKLTKENVKFEWKGNQHCTIIFEHADNQLRKFELDVTQQSVHLEEIPQ